jgi:hypothetical protein
LFKYRAGGRYNKPKIPREERFCKFCTEIETEEHFLISCHKYKDIRKTFFQSYGLDLKDAHNTYFLPSKLLNPKNIIEYNYLYKFIRDVLISLYLWHDIKKCSSVSTSVQNLQYRSSLGILGLLYLPRSIFKQ